jgi:hypothetical protein
MSNYSQIVSFGPKDSLNTGDAAKKIKGTEIDAELAAISTAITSKEDAANKNAANGYCPLNSSSVVPDANLPATLLKAGTAATVTAAWEFEGNNTQTGTLALNGNTTVGASTVVKRGTTGSFINHGSSNHASGVITVSTSSPTGGANGDIWFKV